MGWGVRLGVLALRLGGFFGILAAGGWAVVAMVGTDQLAVAGWFSVAWAMSVIAIAVLVGLRRSPLLGALGIVAGLWSASFAIQLATQPSGDVGSAFGNFWFVMPLVGLFVLRLSIASSSPRLQWFARGLALSWLVESITWLLFDELGSPIGSLSEGALRVVATQWLGLIGFAVWSLWSAGRLAVDTPTPRGPKVSTATRGSPDEPVSAPFRFEAESPKRFDMEELARRSGLSVQELRAAQPTYRRVGVPKRSGGTRHLLVPDDATKALQRRLLRRVLARVPIHPAAHGFERGRSIVSNATPHAGRAVVVRMDVIDFFGTTSARRVRRLFRVLGWDAETAELLTRLTTHEGGLPTGAPTSPRLANLVNVLLDARLTGLAAALGACYTRYADDLTFSFERDDHAALADLLGATRRITRAHGYRIHVARKLQIRRRHHRQSVTGLVVNERVALPRQRRRWLRAVEHRLYSGREATLTREQLAGWQAFESMVETSGAEPRRA